MVEMIILFIWGCGVAACVVPSMPAMKHAVRHLARQIDVRNNNNAIANDQYGTFGSASARNAANTNMVTSIKSQEELTEYIVALSCVFAEVGMLSGALIGAGINEYLGFSVTMVVGAFMCSLYFVMAGFFYTRYHSKVLYPETATSAPNSSRTINN